MLRAVLGRSFRANSRLACRTYARELPVAKDPAAPSNEPESTQGEHALGQQLPKLGKKYQSHSCRLESSSDHAGEGSDFWRQLDVLEQPKPGPQVFDRSVNTQQGI